MTPWESPKPTQLYSNTLHPETGVQDIPVPLPDSALYELRGSPNAGRGVFASVGLSPGTHLMTTSIDSSWNGLSSVSTTSTDSNDESFNTEELSTPYVEAAFANPPHRHLPVETLSPLAWLIQRPYRKEVCAECFVYDRGREWKVKARYPDGGDCSVAGVVFCSEMCRDVWVLRNGDVGVQAWAALEEGVQQIMKQSRNRHDQSSDTQGDGELVLKGPSEAETYQAWTTAGQVGETIITARMKDKPSKSERKIVKSVIEAGGDPDLMYYILTAVLSAYNTVQRRANRLRNFNVTQISSDCGSAPASPPIEPATTPRSSSTTSTNTPLSSHPSTSTPSHAPLAHSYTFPLPSLLALTPSTPFHAYQSPHTSLTSYTNSHLYLLTLLPLPLLPLLTPSLTHNLNTRAAHNAFSIRPTDTSDYDNECLGWGVWPQASFWNHSCRPNVAKQRQRRCWVFHSAAHVARDEELCVSYLGGEEETLGVEERRARLRAEWGFVCMCARCVEESAGK